MSKMNQTNAVAEELVRRLNEEAGISTNDWFKEHVVVMSLDEDDEDEEELLNDEY